MNSSLFEGYLYMVVTSAKGLCFIYVCLFLLLAVVVKNLCINCTICTKL